MTKVIQQRDKCIGCGTCVAVCPAFWHMAEDGKSTLKDSKDVGGNKFELEIVDPGCNKDAVASCPVQIIAVEE